jgi:crossover junction endodeoxyribonuclease RuvC
MRVLGIDPGMIGGFAIVESAPGVAARIVEATDIPVAGVGTKQRVDAAAIRKCVEGHALVGAFIERAGVMPGQGISSGFRYGRAVGAIETAVVLCGIPVVFVEPSQWKRHFRLPGKDKEAARQKALQLFPGAHELLARKKDHGRAEAALIALYGVALNNRGGNPDAI